jgi:hypothetical protein
MTVKPSTSARKFASAWSGAWQDRRRVAAGDGVERVDASETRVYVELGALDDVRVHAAVREPLERARRSVRLRGSRWRRLMRPATLRATHVHMTRCRMATIKNEWPNNTSPRSIAAWIQLFLRDKSAYRKQSGDRSCT